MRHSLLLACSHTALKLSGSYHADAVLGSQPLLLLSASVFAFETSASNEEIYKCKAVLLEITVILWVRLIHLRLFKAHLRNPIMT